MIKLLADENIPQSIVGFLRDRGFDVKEVSGAPMAGASDNQVMDLAFKEQRGLLTFDKHFANILLYPPSSHHGIIRIRIHSPLIEDIIQAFNQVLKEFDLNTMGGSSIVLEREGFRLRRIP